MSPQQRTKPIFTPGSGPPSVPRPDHGILEAIGKEGVFALLSAVYRRLETSSIRPMFAKDLEAASRRSAAFFVQVMGGGPLYTEQFGPPRMRQRHFPFELDEASRLIWLGCFKEALHEAVDQHGFPPEHVPGFETYLNIFSQWMVNVAPEG